MDSVGRILILPKGPWNNETDYEMLDLVYYGGTSWLAKKNSKGVTPVDGEYWQKVFDYNEYSKQFIMR